MPLSYALCKLFTRKELIFEMLIKQLFKDAETELQRLGDVARQGED